MSDTLQIYGLYINEKPLWNDSYLLLLYIDGEYLSGLMFDKETLKMDSLFTMQKSVAKFKRVGGIFPICMKQNFKLKLEKIE